jgi:nicotinamide mononucleotide (NMN) deamidase PncC
VAPAAHPLAEAAAAVASLLSERRETVAVAESSAGGLISAALLAVPGASAYFLGGGVIYTRAARQGLLQLPDEALAGMRASTEAYARLKARPGTATATPRGTPAWPWPGPSSGP